MSDDDTSRFGSKRRPFLQAGAGTLALSVAGCLGDDDDDVDDDDDDDATPPPVDDDDDVPTGGNFRYGMSQEPEGLNPLATSSAYSWVMLDELYEGGTSLDPVTFEVHPNVFTDWTVENVESGEPDVYFDVRDGLDWNDGTDFSIDDVIFSYNYIMEAMPGRYADAVAPIEFVEEADTDWDVHMKLTRPVGTYDSTQLSVPILPEHRWNDVDPAEFQEYQPTDNTYEVDGEEYLGPVGLGPGRVTRYEADTSVEVVYRDGYTLNDLEWIQDHPNLRSGGPFLDSIRVMIYGSMEALQQAFISEDAIDALFGSILPANIDDVEEMPDASIVTGFDTGYGHYSFNMRNTPLDDTIFRQALGFCFDHFYWLEQLNRGTEQRGAFAMPPGYEAVRPETEAGVEMNEHPATMAFDFVEDQPSVPHLEAIKSFLQEGEPIHGEEGTYADGQREYPGSLTGVTADETEARHDYSWGEVETDDVLDPDIVEAEIRVNGETIPEILGRPLEMMMVPPADSPLSAQMVDDFIGNLHQLGIPVERDVMTFNTMLDEVYRLADFDIFPMSWGNLSPFAASSLQGLFHSDNAHGPDSDHDVLLNNPMGYGLDGLPGADDLIDETLEEMDVERRNSLARQAVEKVYLDYPTQINSHEIPHWPVRDGEFAGFIEGIPDPGATYVNTQFSQIHLRE